MGEKHKAERPENIENRLRSHRTARGWSQGQLADAAQITRQAVCAIEANQYLPTTAVALRLAGALHCKVEDLFSLISTGDLIEGELVRTNPSRRGSLSRSRVKVAMVGERIIVRPMSALGEVLSYTVPADGLIVDHATGRRGEKSSARVKVRLLRDRRAVEQDISVAGCDPAIFLAGEYVRRRDNNITVIGWSMGSAAAVEAVKAGEVHVAGLHVVDAKSGESNLPFLRKHLKEDNFTVVTFATWEEGWIVAAGNPKSIRDVGDLTRREVRIVNRESGAGARMLLDRQLADAGIPAERVSGYTHEAMSHFEVARVVAEGQADVGVGVRSAAMVLGLDFIPVQVERYDLVIPTKLLKTNRGLEQLLDTIVSRPFRTEVEALGGYDTSQTGKVHHLRAS
ncbi:MAG TPA: substrate-binding domain-containing protein [Nitrospiraceae bacterium]|nr:substrate-binding domain-containing protein [Nitrospiraceae bacterium]